MATTPTLLIPYVVPTDIVAEYPTADKAKADRLEVLLADTGWVNLTPKSGTGTLQYRVRSWIVELRCGLSGVASIASGSTGTLLDPGVIPPALVPAVGAGYMAGNAGGNTMILAVLNTSGSLTVLNPSAISISAVRFTGTWIKEGMA